MKRKPPQERPWPKRVAAIKIVTDAGETMVEFDNAPTVGQAIARACKALPAQKG